MFIKIGLIFPSFYVKIVNLYVFRTIIDLPSKTLLQLAARTIGLAVTGGLAERPKRQINISRKNEYGIFSVFFTVFSLLFHCFFTVFSLFLLFHCCFTVVSLLFHCDYTVVSLWCHWFLFRWFVDSFTVVSFVGLPGTYGNTTPLCGSPIPFTSPGPPTTTPML